MPLGVIKKGLCEQPKETQEAKVWQLPNLCKVVDAVSACTVTSKLTLETAKVLIKFSSSSMLPWLADSICRIVSSSKLSSAFMCALFTIRLDFISDKSGRSCSK